MVVKQAFQSAHIQPHLLGVQSRPLAGSLDLFDARTLVRSIVYGCVVGNLDAKVLQYTAQARWPAGVRPDAFVVAVLVRRWDLRHIGGSIREDNRRCDTRYQ